MRMHSAISSLNSGKTGNEGCHFPGKDTSGLLELLALAVARGMSGVRGAACHVGPGQVGLSCHLMLI